MTWLLGFTARCSAIGLVCWLTRPRVPPVRVADLGLARDQDRAERRRQHLPT